MFLFITHSFAVYVGDRFSSVHIIFSCYFVSFRNMCRNKIKNDRSHRSERLLTDVFMAGGHGGFFNSD